MLRECPSCGSTKNEFPERASKCKVCIKEYKRQWDLENHLKNKMYKREYRKRKKSCGLMDRVTDSVL